MRSAKCVARRQNGLHVLHFAFEKTQKAKDEAQNGPGRGACGQGDRGADNSANIAFDSAGEQEHRTGRLGLQIASRDHSGLRILQYGLVGKRQGNTAFVHMHILSSNHGCATLANLDMVGADILGAALLDNNTVSIDIGWRRSMPVLGGWRIAWRWEHSHDSGGRMELVGGKGAT